MDEDTLDNEDTIEESDSDDEFMWFYLSFIPQILTCTRVIKNQRSPPVNRFVITQNRGYDHFLLALRQPQLFRRKYRMLPSTFQQLALKLEPYYQPAGITRLPLQYALGIFLAWAAQHSTYRDMCYEFQVATSVIFTVVEQFINICIYALWRDEISQPQVSFIMAREQKLRRQFSHMRRLYEVFDGAVALLDGTAVRCNAVAEVLRNPNKGTCVNILVLTDLMGRFRAMAPGFGSENDASVFRQRLCGVRLPPDTYIIADSGFGLAKRVLTPTNGTRYRTYLFANDDSRPRTPEELFNRVHASIRNTIERSFGQLKGTFPVCGQTTMEPMKIFPTFYALAGVHNFIRETEGELKYDLEINEDMRDTEECFNITEATFVVNPELLCDSKPLTAEMKQYRARVQARLWVVYNAVMEEMYGNR